MDATTEFEVQYAIEVSTHVTRTKLNSNDGCCFNCNSIAFPHRELKINNVTKCVFIAFHIILQGLDATPDDHCAITAEQTITWTIVATQVKIYTFYTI